MELTTTGEVMDALGGNAGTAELTGSTLKRVWNWRKGGKFPPKFHLLMTSALERKGLSAPARLWGMAQETCEAPSS